MAQMEKQAETTFGLERFKRVVTLIGLIGGYCGILLILQDTLLFRQEDPLLEV